MITGITLNAWNQIGSQRLPISHQLDVRFEKNINISHGQSCPSARTCSTSEPQHGAGCDAPVRPGTTTKPSSIMDPRIIEVGATYSF